MELNEDNKIPFDTHYRHHVWTDKQIGKQEKRDAWMSDIYKHVVKVGVIVVLGWVLSLIVLGGEAQLKDVVKKALVEEVIKND